MTIGQRLVTLRKDIGLKQKKAAELLDMTPTTLFKYENDIINDPPSSKIGDMADLYNTTIEYILYGNVGENKIPILGVVPCGEPIEAIENILGYIDVPRKMTKNHFGLIAQGNSMNPEIRSGDIMTIRQTPTVDSGKIAIVKINGDEATCKKIMINEAGITLIPLNTDYEPQFFNNEQIENLPISIIGEVVGINRKY